MSLFSRLFRKAPARPSVPTSSSQEAPGESRDPRASGPGVPDRAAVAAMEEKALQAAIEQRDMQAIARWVVTGTSTRVRQLAAHAIEDPVALRQLIREVRGGNDK